MNFSGQVAFVTGAARGIGRATAEAFADSGAQVVLCDALPEPSGLLAELAERGGEAAYVQADVADPDSVEAAIRFTTRRFGRLDFAFNNAGVSSTGLTADLSVADWQRVIGVNLTGTFLCMRYEIPELLKTGGCIVNTASIWAQVGSAGKAAYSAAKHGVAGLTRSAAHEYAAQGLRVNAVAPGPIATDMTAAMPADAMRAIVDRTAQKRFGRSGEVAAAVTWLCSPEASFVNGVVLPVDGGYLAN
ncbi:SDR family NAD(P)-dependent oxidoreductase [Streptomyces sp. Y7]|uniref:SDR family NAD(P)-dependent oxidoreductase n=1 Tax=Streptomyces sp. Y7 TaxID=3342392 RepID=UPI003718BD90